VKNTRPNSGSSKKAAGSSNTKAGSSSSIIKEGKDTTAHKF